VHPLLDQDGYKALPLWAQVLLAARATRRAVLWMPASVSASVREKLIAGCDALDRSAEAGSRSREDKRVLDRAAAVQPCIYSHGAATAMYYAVDSAHAAEDSLDFSAAESACTGSAGRAIAAASESRGLNPLQVQIFVSADLDLLTFTCKEARVGRYDGLGQQVMGRLVPVYPPDTRDTAEAGRS
jgi:hypothetical protein